MHPSSIDPAASVQGSGSRAFPTHADPSRYFPAETFEAARKRLVMNLTRGEGPALLVASPGCGKTMLIEVLAAELKESLRVVRLASTQLCTRRALLQAILFGLDEPYRDREEGELRLALVQAIQHHEAASRPIALLIDEAQSLPVRLIEELRLLSNISAEGEPSLRLLLCGATTLDELLASPELEALNQRIAARCYLSPLSRDETTQYVRSHVAAAGGAPDELFADDAYLAIHQASDGLPRLINQVCDRALVMAVEGQESKVTADSIQAAWSDLHQLPAPWHSPSPSPLASHQGESDETPIDSPTVEFGLLEDDLDSQYEPVQDNETEAEPLDAATGDWIADEGLKNLPSIGHQDESEESSAGCQGGCSGSCSIPRDEPSECISLSFPTEEERDSDPQDDPVFESAYEPEVELPIDSSTPQEDFAADPFAESFDEEECVLQQCQGLEEIVRPGSETVTNQQDFEVGRMFAALEPAVENLLEDVQQRINGPELSGGFTLVSDRSAAEDVTEQTDPVAEELTPAPLSEETVIAPSVDPEPPYETDSADAADDRDMLVVEEDEPQESPDGASLQDYRQLFANLREQ